MPSPLHPVLGHIRRVAALGAGSDLTDACLLRRFVTERDEAAFEADGAIRLCRLSK